MKNKPNINLNPVKMTNPNMLRKIIEKMNAAKVKKLSEVIRNMTAPKTNMMPNPSDKLRIPNELIAQTTKVNKSKQKNISLPRTMVKNSSSMVDVILPDGEMYKLQR